MMDALLKHPVYMFSLRGQTANEVRRFVQGVEGQNSEKRSWLLIADRESLYLLTFSHWISDTGSVSSLK